jgi:carbamoyltransferase
LRHANPRRLAAQAGVDLHLLGKEAGFRSRWGYRGRIVHVGHHDAHAASAFYASPFEEAAVLTLDRGGEWLSTTLQHGRGTRLRRLAVVRNPHSLGEMYSAITSYLGFETNADEGKVMGLAPYGRGTLVPELRKLVRRTPDGLFRADLSWFDYQREYLREDAGVSHRFLARYGPPRVREQAFTDVHLDLARAAQAVLEEVAIHVARSLQRRTEARNLCLAGGVALNSVMNTRLLRSAGFERIFVQPVASDAGNALGAALWAWHQRLGHPRGQAMTHAYWGAEYAEPDFHRALAVRGLPARLVNDPPSEAARLLAEGKVVGWFQGRAEVGPRALGARSILADPRQARMRDLVNARVKRREWFRPFAPSVLHERGADWFHGWEPNPFMLLVQPVRTDRRAAIPAVTHVDGSARVQSVHAHHNPGFHALISHFEHRTGVPVVLNTSLNLRGEPIVHRPAEAIDDFLTSEMDALFLGRLLVEKGCDGVTGR